MSSTGLAKTACIASAYLRSMGPVIFYCDQAPHDGEHTSEKDGVQFRWSFVDGGFPAARAAAPEPEPFDRSREQWFTGTCANEFCFGAIRGRSLDGAPAYWRHDIRVLDNDHDAVAG